MGSEHRSLLELLRAATRLLRFERLASGSEATSVSRLSVLTALAEHDVLDVEGLAAKELVRGPSMVEALKPLVSCGWISKDADPADRRRVRLRLTPSGKRHLRAEQQRLDRLWATLYGNEWQAVNQATAALEILVNSAQEDSE